MRTKRFIASALAITMVFSMFAANFNSTVADAAKVKVKSVKVSAPYAKQINIAKGKSVKLSTVVKVTPNKKANKKLKYVSKNKKIITVNSKGVVKAKAVGKTKIVVSSKKNKKKKATIKVTVFKSAIKKIKLNKSTVTLTPGETITLKASVTPKKKVSKDIVWYSSKAGVAKVSERGVVTAVAAGTTVIKASATDGSKKSAKCTVKVQQVTNIVSAEAIDSSTIRVTLSRAEALSLSSFQIQGKETVEGSYVRSYSVKALNSTDMINYDISIDSDKEEFYTNEYLKVSIPALSGAKSIEFKAKFRLMQCGLSESVITGEVGDFIGDNSISFGRYTTGEATYSVAGLPAGLSTKVENGILYISGTPTAVADNVIATATAVDETGKSVTKNIHILVGSDSTIVAYTKPVFLLSNQCVHKCSGMYVAGGSGSYSFNTTKDAGLMTLQNVDCSCDGSTFLFDNNKIQNLATGTYSKGILPAGDYSAACQITDSYNKALTINKTVNISVRDGVTVTGTLTDAAGAPISGEYVYADCLTSYDLYNMCNYNDGNFASEYPTDNTGKYVLRVYNGQTYDIYGCGAQAYNQPIMEAATVNLKSIYYKVTIPAVADNASLYSDKENSDYMNSDHGYDYTTYTLKRTDALDEYLYVRNGVAYVLPGTYNYRNSSTLYSHDQNGSIIGRYNMLLGFTVTDTDIIASPQLINQNKGTLSAGVPVNISIAGNSSGHVTFTAPDRGNYAFTSDAVNRNISCNESEFAAGKKLYETTHLNKGEIYTLYFTNYRGLPVSINNLMVTLQPEELPDSKGTLAIDTPVTVSIDSYSKCYLEFTAPEDGTYDFVSDVNDNTIAFDEKTFKSGDKPSISLYFNKGEYYKLYIENLDWSSATVNNIKVSKQPAENK